MGQKRIVIAGTGSGAGKTTITVGLMAALKKQGFVVQGFKCGPDYIDPTYHTAVTGRVSRNLDSWMMQHDVVREIFVRGSEGADISVIEGVAGLFDGKNPLTNEGSTAEISNITNSPILLVVNCASMGRSAAAIVKGFQCFSEGVHIAGVIANRVGSEKHYHLIKEAVEQECGIPVIGYLIREEEIEIPERHLGLVPSLERGDLQPLFDRLADLLMKTVDMQKLLQLSTAEPVQVNKSLFAEKSTGKNVRIAVAKDAAFHFYYPENLELLEAYGAEIVFFSPLRGEKVPDNVQGLYIGGGFPEEFADELSSHKEVTESIRRAILAGLPTLAECGGFMYLTEEIETTDGYSFPMVGLIPGKIKMQKRLAALGYRKVGGTEENFLFGPGDWAKGHEFHYSTFSPKGEYAYAYRITEPDKRLGEGYVRRNLIAGYTHLHFASNPEMVRRWIEKCNEVERSQRLMPSD